MAMSNPLIPAGYLPSGDLGAAYWNIIDASMPNFDPRYWAGIPNQNYSYTPPGWDPTQESGFDWRWLIPQQIYLPTRSGSTSIPPSTKPPSQPPSPSQVPQWTGPQTGDTRQGDNDWGTLLMKGISGIPQWAGGTGGSNMGSFSPTTNAGGWLGTLGNILGGVFRPTGSGGSSGGDAASAVQNLIYNILPQAQQGGGGSPFPFFLPYPVGNEGGNLDFTPYTNYLNWLMTQNNPWVNVNMPQMFPQVQGGYNRANALGNEGYSQLILGGNTAERMGQGIGLMTPQQKALQSSVMGQINTGGLTPETVAAMRRLILEPQQEQMLANVNKLAGGDALLTSPAYQEMIRRNDQNFMDQLLTLGMQNQPQYYSLANQITQQPMQQAATLGNLYGNLGQVGGNQGLGWYGGAGNLGLGMQNSAANMAGNILSGYGNMYNTQQSQQNAQNIARAQSYGMMAPYMMANATNLGGLSWPNWPTGTGTTGTYPIPGIPSTLPTPQPKPQTGATPYAQMMLNRGR